MTHTEVDLASQVQRGFPQATAQGRACWSVAMQNGRSHNSRVSLEDDILVLTTGPLAINGSPQSVMAMNPSLGAASRIVCATDGLQFRTEWAVSADGMLRREAMISQIWEASLCDFQRGLDVLSGAPIPQPVAFPTQSREEQEPAPHWNARAEGEGAWMVPLPHEKVSLRASALLVKVDAITQGEWPDEVRSAISEYLLRATSQLRFVKACATSDSNAQWSAWIEASPVACGMEEALICVALAYREFGAAVRALSEVRLAQRFHEIGSVWRAGLAPISKQERR